MHDQSGRRGAGRRGRGACYLPLVTKSACNIKSAGWTVSAAHRGVGGATAVAGAGGRGPLLVVVEVGAARAGLSAAWAGPLIEGSRFGWTRGANPGRVEEGSGDGANW